MHPAGCNTRHGATESTMPFDFYSENLYIKGMIEQGNPEKWRRAEWKKAAGTRVQNKDLWELFLEGAKEHEIEFRYSKYNDYKETLKAVMNGEEIEV